MKKLFLVLVMIVSSLIAKPLNGDIDFTNDNIIQNNVTETQAVVLENTITDNLSEPNETNIETKKVEDITNEDSFKEKNNIADNKEPVIENKTPKNENKGINNNSEKQVQKKQQVTEKTPEPKVEKKQEEQVKQVEPPKTESKAKQEEKIYCVDGGKVHIYGDGANEHGYYKTWDEAFKAYEEYTKGWESTQFKVDQCACGLYYFWVIK